MEIYGAALLNCSRNAEAKTGERLLTDGEAREQAEGRAEQAEAENARLLAELARLRGEET